MPLVVGERLGPYEITGAVGAGGMGEVYAARDPRIDRDVAIKVMPKEFAVDPERRQRFEREARAVGALSHANVLVIYDVGEHDDVPYLVTELLLGESLSDRLSGGGVSRAEALDIAVQAARGLAAVHNHGILHRDLKPSNLFLCDDGTVKILDFGVARRTTSDDTVTRSGAVLGTPRYMSPEQVRGRELTERSDLFSLGVVLYEMLAGHRPFAGDTDLEVAAAILEQQPTELQDSQLDRIVKRCLAKDPTARFDSAKQLEAALLVGRAPRGWKLPVGISAGLLAAAGIAVWAYDRVDDGPAVREPETAPVVAAVPLDLRESRLTSMPPDKWVITLAASADGEMFAYSNHDGLIVQRPGAGVPRKFPLKKGLTHNNVYGFFPDGRHLMLHVVDDENADIVKLDLALGSTTVVRKDAAPGLLSPDGRHAMILTPGMTPERLSLFDLETGEDRVLDALGAEPRDQFAQAWSPDSRYLAAVAWWPDKSAKTKSLVVVPIDGGEASVMPVDGELGGATTWRDDRRLLYTQADANGGSSLWEVRIIEGRWDREPPRKLYAWTEFRIDWMAYRGQRLYFVKNRQQEDVYLRAIGADGTFVGEPARLTHHDGQDQFRGSWAADDRVLFSSDRFGTWDLFVQAPGASDAELILGGPHDDRNPTQAGDAILFWREDAAPRETCRLMRLEAHQTKPRELLTRPCRGPSVACSSKAVDRCVLVEMVGKRLAVFAAPAWETTIVSRLDPATGELRELRREPTTMLWPNRPHDIDASGRNLVVSYNGDVATIDVETGELEIRARGVEVKGVVMAAFAEPRPGWLTLPRVWNTSGLVWTKPDGSKTELWKIGTDKLRFHSVSPSGDYLAAARIVSESNVWMLEGLP